MKKTLIFIIVVSVVVSITSCKKEYICTCVTQIEGAADQEQDFVNKTYRKEKAKSKCDLNEYLATTPNTICTLK